MPVAVSVTPVITPAETSARRFGVNAGAISVARASRIVTAPIRMPRWLAVRAAKIHSPPNVPAKRPAVIQPAPAKSSAARSRHATYTLSGIISTSRQTGRRSGAKNARTGASMSANPTPMVPWTNAATIHDRRDQREHGEAHFGFRACALCAVE
jgi:hypothetical protein